MEAYEKILGDGREGEGWMREVEEEREGVKERERGLRGWESEYGRENEK